MKTQDVSQESNGSQSNARNTTQNVGHQHYVTKEIFPDFQAFNHSLSLVHDSNPMGVNTDNKNSMAIALHTIKEGVTCMD
jgi:hypothetical protein